ncbi:hypothetical protein SB717_34705, partial [Priestia sp. SIMBA_032]
MLSEKQYRAALDIVLNIPKGDGANWNNDFILGCAMHGLVLLPVRQSPNPPFMHYGLAPISYQEENGHRAWSESWIVDGDYEDHLKKEV